MTGRSTKNSAKNLQSQSSPHVGAVQTSTSLPSPATSGVGTSAAAISVISDNVLDAMEKRIVSSITTIINEKMLSLQTSIAESVSESLRALSAEVASLRATVGDLTAKCKTFEDQLNDVQRVKRLSDVVIHHIPHVESLNPSVILKKLSDVIGHTVSPFVDAFRLKQRHNPADNVHKPSVSNPIIVRFSCYNEKNCFLQKFKRHGQLKLHEIDCGFSSDATIRAYESLTLLNNAILRSALRMCRAGKLFSTFTKNGFVYVRRFKEDAAVKVLDCSQLEPIVSSYTSSS